MTAHVHDPATDRGAAPAPDSPGPAPMAWTRPRWLVPGLLVALVVAGLVVAGVLPFSAVLYGGLFGGMVLMHAGGHGHGGHGGHGGGGHAAHGDGASAQGKAADDVTESLRLRSPDSQSRSGTLDRGLGDRAATTMTTDETKDDDEHRSHSCH